MESRILQAPISRSPPPGRRSRAATSPARPPSLEKVLEAEPGNKVALRYLGFAYIKLKKYAEGRATYAKLLDLVPDSPQALYNTGVSLRPRGQHGRRLRVARKGEGHREARHDADPGGRGPEVPLLGSPLRGSAAETLGFRKSLPRVREGRPHPGVGRRGAGRPVRLDRTEPGRRGRRRRRRLRHILADLVRRRQGGRPRLRLLDEERKASLEGRRRHGGRARHGCRARGRREQGRRARRRRRRARRRQGAHLFGQGRPRAPDAHRRGQDRRLRPPRHDGRRRRRRRPRRRHQSARPTTPPAARTRGARTSIPARTAGSSIPGPGSAKATTSAPPPPATRAAR